MTMVIGAVGTGFEIHGSTCPVRQIAMHGNPADARVQSRVRWRNRRFLDGIDRERKWRLQQGQVRFVADDILDIPRGIRRLDARGKTLQHKVVNIALTLVAKNLTRGARRQEMHQVTREPFGPGLVEDIHPRRLDQWLPQLQCIIGAEHRIGGAIRITAFRAAPDIDRIDVGAERKIEPGRGRRDIAHRQGRDNGQVAHRHRAVGIVRFIVETVVVAGKVGIHRGNPGADCRHPARLARRILVQLWRNQIRHLGQCQHDAARGNVVIDITGHAVRVERRQLIAARQRFLQILGLARDPVQQGCAQGLVGRTADRTRNLRDIGGTRRRWRGRRQRPLCIGRRGQAGQLPCHLVAHLDTQPGNRRAPRGLHGARPGGLRQEVGRLLARSRMGEQAGLDGIVFWHFE